MCEWVYLFFIVISYLLYSLKLDSCVLSLFKTAKPPLLGWLFDKYLSAFIQILNEQA